MKVPGAMPRAGPAQPPNCGSVVLHSWIKCGNGPFLLQKETGLEARGAGGWDQGGSQLSKDQKPLQGGSFLLMTTGSWGVGWQAVCPLLSKGTSGTPDEGLLSQGAGMPRCFHSVFPVLNGIESQADQECRGVKGRP